MDCIQNVTASSVHSVKLDYTCIQTVNLELLISLIASQRWKKFGPITLNLHTVCLSLHLFLSSSFCPPSLLSVSVSLILSELLYMLAVTGDLMALNQTQRLYYRSFMKQSLSPIPSLTLSLYYSFSTILPPFTFTLSPTSLRQQAIFSISLPPL